LRTPLLDSKFRAFFRNKQEVIFDFSASEISSDGAFLLLEKIERKSGLLKDIANIIPDNRDPLHTIFSNYHLLKQRCFAMIQGYEDTNDVQYLKNDPIFKNILGGDLASQPSLSRFENRVDKLSIFNLCHLWIDRYVASLKGRKEIIIDIDATDDPTHGNQQMSLFSGFYEQFMYNELFFHDAHSGQIILPVLRPGNSHSNKWYVSILKRIVRKIKEVYPTIQITIRADSGFSCPAFLDLAKSENLFFVMGIASNAVLKTKTIKAEKAVRLHYLDKGLKHQHFFGFKYQAKSWAEPQQCYSKVESTGKGMNIRHIITNIPEKNGRQIYFDVYVKRGDASENRIKEVKNMCFSDRLSTHRFWSNFLRLFISCASYEYFLTIRKAIQKTTHKIAHKWQVSTIRASLLKFGACLKESKKRVYFQFSKAFVHQKIFVDIMNNI
jgi:Transposase DDE domain group 1